MIYRIVILVLYTFYRKSTLFYCVYLPEIAAVFCNRGTMLNNTIA